LITISVIIVNYNGKSLLGACLESVYGQSLNNIEVILVDNASNDGSVEYVSAAFPATKIVSLQSNCGFAGANAEGLKYTGGNYIMLLNNDAEVDRDCLRNLYSAMEEAPEVGICATKMLISGRDVIDSAGDGFSTLLLKGFKRGEGEDPQIYERREHVFGACAGAALYRRKMLEDVGFFDQDFFLIQEDTDLNFRAQLAGWKVLYVPSAIAYHKVRSTIGSMSDIAVYYSLRNSEFVRIKNIPSGIFVGCFPFYIIGMLLEFLYFAIKHKRFFVYLKAKRDAIRFFPKMWRKRRTIMDNKRVQNRYIYGLMSPFWHRGVFFSKVEKFLNG
jgi:GT2 family glycosyltransferase